MPRHEARRHSTKLFAGAADHVAFGAAYVSQHRLPEIEPREFGQQALHRQDRDGKLNHVCALTGLSEAASAAIHYPEFDR
jgi:hypothetical protein